MTLPNCYECKRPLREGESAWVYDWTVITPDGPVLEYRYSCDDCGNGGAA